jgi:hypothetical protein
MQMQATWPYTSRAYREVIQAPTLRREISEYPRQIYECARRRDVAHRSGESAELEPRLAWNPTSTVRLFRP